jgi:peptidoglycan/LPS O-acetylase OafA/YrhL
LSIFYPYPRLQDGHLPIQYYLAPILVTILFYGAYRTRKYSRLIVFGLLFFTANIIFVLQLLSVGDAIKADRYTYVSYLGLFFIIGMGVDHLYNTNRVQFRINKTLIAVLTVAILICFCVISYYRTKVWKNETLIANDLLQKFPNDYLALNNKGFITNRIITKKLNKHDK